MLHRIAQVLAISALLLRLPSLFPETAAAAPATCDLRSCPALLTVDHNGIYRITGSYLRRHGFDWSQVSGAELSLQLEGQPVPRAVSTSGLLGDSAYIEFYAPSFHSRYTTRAVYRLSVDRSRALPAATILAAPGSGPAIATFSAHYVESRRTVYDPDRKST